MPTRPAIHQPHFAKTPEQRAEAARERMRERDAERPSSHERGYDAEWRALRARFIATHPRCSVCGEPTVDVDHRHSIRDRPELRLDESNLRPYCHKHHAQRTARDQGFASADRPQVSKRAAARPDWLRPARVPLQIVCGPRGAGKSRYVEQRASVSDLVLDLDEIIASLSGRPLFAIAGAGAVNDAIRHRNRELGRLATKYTRYSGAWLILSEPTADARRWWRERLRPISFVVFDVALDVCDARIDADPRRDAVRIEHHRAAALWWERFEPEPGERRASLEGGRV
jgi:5-methylcytosine-specific restriction enzyme A